MKKLLITSGDPKIGAEEDGEKGVKLCSQGSARGDVMA